MFYGNGMFMGGMHWLWWIFWLLLVGALVYSSWGRPSGQRRPPRDTPQQVLQRRLANGEISPEEYEKLKVLLDRDSGGKV